MLFAPCTCEKRRERGRETGLEMMMIMFLKVFTLLWENWEKMIRRKISPSRYRFETGCLPHILSQRYFGRCSFMDSWNKQNCNLGHHCYFYFYILFLCTYVLPVTLYYASCIWCKPKTLRWLPSSWLHINTTLRQIVRTPKYNEHAALCQPRRMAPLSRKDGGRKEASSSKRGIRRKD